MTAHHEQAVQLSIIKLAKDGDPSVQASAREIVRARSYEIGRMRMRLGMWGFDPAVRKQEPMAGVGMSVFDDDRIRDKGGGDDDALPSHELGVAGREGEPVGSVLIEE